MMNKMMKQLFLFLHYDFFFYEALKEQKFQSFRQHMTLLKYMQKIQ